MASLNNALGRRTPCPSWSPSEDKNDLEGETYEHWRKRVKFWLRGETETNAPYASTVREFTTGRSRTPRASPAACLLARNNTAHIQQ